MSESQTHPHPALTVGTRVRINDGHDYYPGELGRIIHAPGEYKYPDCICVLTDCGHKVAYLVSDVTRVDEVAYDELVVKVKS